MSDYSETAAAFAAGMAQCQREQAAGVADPMGGAVPLDAGPPEQQPYVPPEPGGEDGGGVT